MLAQGTPTPPATSDWLPQILGLLARQTGHDFADYKPKTIERRIERRMAIHQIATAEVYHRYLQEDSLEAPLLFADLLIGVTQFFRDPEAFAALQAQAMPYLLGVHKDGQGLGPVRVWVPGCATGEEAFSIAMLMQEFMEASGSPVSVTIFASDMDSRAIDRARSATYPLSIAADVSPERLARFFVEVDGKYRIVERIRNMIVFAVHDLVKDPPFSRLDLISCRNLLIYLDTGAQTRMASTFHYALKPGGLLFLGTAELPETSRRLFVPLDRKHRIFRRSDDTSVRTALPYLPKEAAHTGMRAASSKAKESVPVNLRASVEKVLLANAPLPHHQRCG